MTFVFVSRFSKFLCTCYDKFSTEFFRKILCLPLNKLYIIFENSLSDVKNSTLVKKMYVIATIYKKN